MEVLDLGELTGQLCSEGAYDAGRMALDLREGVTVKGDAALLGRLIENLIDNAFKYGGKMATEGSPGGRSGEHRAGNTEQPDFPQVRISVFHEQGEALLSVRDYGQGIPFEVQDKIWQRFFQADASHSGQEGAGLGLAMVRQIAELHGGRMTLESRPGRGSCFTLHLPMAQ